MSKEIRGRIAPSAGLRIGRAEAALPASSRVMTAKGPMPAARIEAGARLITRRGIATVKAVVRCTTPDATRCVLVTRDALGGKPERDTILLPTQRLLVRDWRAKAIWGLDAATPPVGRLIDGDYIRWADTGPGVMVALYFGRPEIIYVDGLELASADPIPAEAAPEPPGS